MAIQNYSPILRFPDFIGEWVFKKLNEITDKITDGTHDTPKQLNEGIPFLTAIHIKDGNIDYDNCYYLSEEDHKIIYKRCNPEKGDLLLVNIGAGTASCAINTVEYAFSLKNVALIKPNKEIIFPNFLEQIQRKNTAKTFNQLTSGGAQPFLSLKAIGKIKIPHPTLPEQQKIATFLTSVDDKIKQLTRKKALLEKYKKGVSQKIFNQEIRFKDEDGNEFPDWEVKSLDEIIIESRLGGNYSNSETKTDFPLIKMGNLGRGKFNLNKIEFIEDGQKINFKDKICFGDLFFNTRNTLDLVGKVAIWKNELNEAYYNSNLMFMKFQNNFFMNYLFNSHQGIKSLKSIATGTTSVAAIYTKDLVKLRFSLPSSNEQKKIADFLMAIDVKIDIINDQLQKIKAFKKGLLQQMFI